MRASTGAALPEGRSRKGDDRQPVITVNQPSKKLRPRTRRRRSKFDGETRDTGQE